MKKDPIQKILTAAKLMAELGYEEEGVAIAHELERGLRLSNPRIAQFKPMDVGPQQGKGAMDWFTNGYNALGTDWGRMRNGWHAMLKNMANRLWSFYTDLQKPNANMTTEVRDTLLTGLQPALAALEELMDQVDKNTNQPAAPAGQLASPTSVSGAKDWEQFRPKASSKHFMRVADTVAPGDFATNQQSELSENTNQGWYSGSYDRGVGAVLRDVVDIYNQAIQICDGFIEQNFPAPYEKFMQALQNCIKFLQSSPAHSPRQAGGVDFQASKQVGQMASDTAKKGVLYSKASNGSQGFEQAWQENTSLLQQRVQTLLNDSNVSLQDKETAQLILQGWSEIKPTASKWYQEELAKTTTQPQTPAAPAPSESSTAAASPVSMPTAPVNGIQSSPPMTQGADH